MQVIYKGEQALSVNGNLIAKGLNDVDQPTADQLQKLSQQEAYKDKFEFKGGTENITPTGFGLNSDIQKTNEEQGLAPDSDIPGDSETKMVGAAGADVPTMEQDQVERAAEGTIEAPTSTSRKKRH